MFPLTCLSFLLAPPRAAIPTFKAVLYKSLDFRYKREYELIGELSIDKEKEILQTQKCRIERWTGKNNKTYKRVLLNIDLT